MVGTGIRKALTSFWKPIQLDTFWEPIQLVPVSYRAWKKEAERKIGVEQQGWPWLAGGGAAARAWSPQPPGGRPKPASWGRPPSNALKRKPAKKGRCNQQWTVNNMTLLFLELICTSHVAQSFLLYHSHTTTPHPLHNLTERGDDLDYVNLKPSSPPNPNKNCQTNIFEFGSIIIIREAFK